MFSFIYYKKKDGDRFRVEGLWVLGKCVDTGVGVHVLDYYPDTARMYAGLCLLSEFTTECICRRSLHTEIHTTYVTMYVRYGCRYAGRSNVCTYVGRYVYMYVCMYV